MIHTWNRVARAPSEPATVAGSGRGSRIAWWLSWVVVAIMTGSAAVGLWVPAVYRDPVEVVAMLRGFDLVTLVVAVPLLATALLLSQRGGVTARLVWLGMLAYAVYTYALQAFGSTFNALFLPHVLAIPASIAALVLLLANLNVADLPVRWLTGVPARTVGVLLALIALGLGGMWVFYSLRFAITGAPPAESELVLPTSAVHLGYALDLALLVPAYGLASVLLWCRRPWGIVLGAALLVYSLVYQVDYMMALVFQASAGIPGSTAFDPAEPVIIAVLLTAAALLFKHDAEGGKPR